MNVKDDTGELLRFSVDRDGETGEVSLVLFNGDVLKFRDREEVLMLVGMLLNPEVDPQGSFVEITKTEMMLRPDEVRRLRVALVNYVEKALTGETGLGGVDGQNFHDATRLLSDLLGETASRMFIPDREREDFVGKNDFDKGSVLRTRKWDQFRKCLAGKR